MAMSRLPFLFALTASLFACSGNDDSPGRKMARSELARDTAPTLTADEKNAIAEGGFALTSVLLGQLKGDSAANLAFSPFSIGVALSMTYVGAKGVTADEMAKAMHWTLPKQRVSKAFDGSTLELAKRADQALAMATEAAKSSGAAVDPAAFRLHVVNSIWADERMKFVPEFLDVMATDYGNGVTLANFSGAPETERLAINQWVSDETQEKIKDLLPAGAIDANTATVLVNALHLKLPWLEKLDVEPAAKPFTRTDGSTVDATFVGDTQSVGWFEDDSVQAVRIPLQGRSVSMVVALPKKDLKTFEAALDGATLSKLVSSPSSSVHLALPKFRFETAALSLSTALKALGMKAAFIAGQADFSGMGSTGNPLYIGDVFHKAMVGLDEKGVEAAAATAVVITAASDPVVEHTLRADRPFFFAIVDEPTRTVLFAGHVTDPMK
jgi:serpin B